jgi:acyl carrier protein
LVSRDADSVQKKAIQDNLGAMYKDKIPSYMRPNETILLHEYPQTSNGKVDQKRMIQEYFDTAERGKETESFESGTIHERSECIWKEILEVDEVDETMDFFDHGGTSLMLIQLLSDTKNTFGVTLNMGRFQDGFFLSKYISEVSRAIALTLWNSIIEDFQEGVDDEMDFFDLGGTSLSLIQLINDTRELLQIKLIISNFSNGISLQSYLNEIEKSQNTLTAITK